MKIKNIVRCICLVLIFGALLQACRDVDENASIVGKWQGDKSEVKALVTIVPIYTKTDDDFDAVVEFKSDGTGSVLIDGNQTNGTWEWVKVNKELKTSIDFQTTFLEPTETYTIKELTASKLTLSIDKHGTYKDPESGETFEGNVRAILYFNRVGQ